MTTGSKYLYKIQVCNIILIILGLIAVCLAASQFWIVSFNSNRNIDLRLLNWIYVLAGLIGLYTLSRNYGIIVAKTVYCASIAVAIYCTAFYCIMLFKLVRLHDALMREKESHQKQQQNDEIKDNYTVKVVICSVMIFVPAIACLASLVCATCLNSIVVMNQPIWPQYSRDQRKKYRTHRLGIIVLAGIKLLLAICVLALAIFSDYQHQLISSTELFTLMALDHIAALSAIVSAIVEIHSTIINRQSGANYKVAIGMSVIAAVWCLKSLDIEMYPYYYHDIKIWPEAGIVTRNETKTHNAIEQNYLTFIVKSIFVALFGLLFGLNLLSAVHISKFLQYEFCEEPINQNISSKSRCLGLLHFIWGLFLMVLVILGLIDVPWNANYIGADLMWLSVLCLAIGILYITYSSSQLSMNFSLGFICFTCAMEKMCSSINLTYQSVTYPAYLHSPEDLFIGRLILYSMQLAILFFETLTGFFSVVVHGRALKQRYRQAVNSSCKHIALLMGNMFYGVVLVSCNVAFTFGNWMYSESPIEIPFFEMGNGLLVFGISILQVLSLCFPALLPSVTILNIVSASVALFMVSYTISNTYFLATVLFTVEDSRWIIIEVALILTACAAIACITSTFCSTFAAVSFLHSMHQKISMTTSTIVLCDENNYGTQQTLVSQQLQTPPVRHMEEQSIYWSSEENPYYYQTSKRYYDQPYRIDSGCYGYALVNPQMSDSSYTLMGADSSVRVHSGPYLRSISSSAAQTRIRHVFR